MSGRKYGQKGYLEDERPARRPAKGPPRERHGPGGRGLGAPTVTVFKCARCGAAFDPAEVTAEAVCGACGEALHSCVNCRFFDTAAANECRAGVEVRVSAKAKANECASFEAKRLQDFAADGGPEDDPKAAFDSLFDF